MTLDFMRKSKFLLRLFVRSAGFRDDLCGGMKELFTKGLAIYARKT